MAITAFTKKQSPTNSNDFLKNYEELLKRRKSGGVVTGYDTSGNMAMNMGGAIANPTGLDSTVTPTATKTTTNNGINIDDSINSLTELDNIISEGNLSLDDINNVVDYLTNYSNNEFQTLTSEQKAKVMPILNSAMTKIATTVKDVTQNTNSFKTGFENPIGPISPEYANDAQLKSLYGEGQNYGQLINDTNQTADKLLSTATNYRNSLQDEYTQKKNTVNELENNPDVQKFSATKQRLLDEGKIDENGYPIDSSGTRINMNEVPKQDIKGDVWIAPEEQKTSAADMLKEFIGGARQGLGNAVSYIGDKAGIPENNISELIAGGQTKDYNKAQAADNTPQAGQGVQSLYDQYKNGFPNMRPALENVSGIQPVIGNVAGLQDKSMAGSKSTASPSGTPIVPTNVARMAVGSNLGVGSNTVNNNNQSSNNYSNNNNSNNNSSNNNQSNNNSSNKTTSTVTAKTTPKTTSKTSTSSGVNLNNLTSTTNPVSSNVGVGSNNVSTNNNSSSKSLVSTIASIISNLFKRK